MAGNNTRIQKETQRLLAEPCEGISATPYEDNMRYFNVVIAGPLGTPYEGGMFRLELFLPAEYPMGSPKVRFLTKIYHPNVDKLGTAGSLTHYSWGFPNMTHSLHLYSKSPPRNQPPPPHTHTHTNLYTGRICLDILKDKWSPALQIRTVLLSVQALLSAPNPDDPLDNGVAEHWVSLNFTPALVDRFLQPLPPPPPIPSPLLFFSLFLSSWSLSTEN